MRVGSLFSGVGGFDLAFERAGMSLAWQIEIDPHAQAVARYHWPDVERHADVTTASAATLTPVDLLCGGFPCQDLSVAGRRAGLAGERSGLWWEFARLAGELRPEWVVIENVGGLLSSNDGRDLGAILWKLGQLGYWWAYRCFDSQHFGLAQRRLRVFIVGRLGKRGAAEVLLEPEGLPWDPAPRREAGEDVAATLTRGAESGGAGGYAGRRREDDVNLVAATETGKGFWNEDAPPSLRAQPGGMPQTLVARPLAAHASSYRVDVDTAENLIARPLLGEAGQRNSPRTSNLVVGTLGADHGNVRADQAWTGRLVPTLTSKCGEQTGRDCESGAPLVALPLRARHNASHRADSDTYIAHTLRAEGHDASEDGTGRGVPLVPVACDLQNGGIGDICGTIQSEGQATGNRGYGVLAFNWQSGGDCRINASEAGTDALSVGQVPAIVSKRGGGDVSADLAPTLDGGGGGGLGKGMAATTPMGVRRLTPTECERLQGFPDGWTAHGRREDGSVYRLKDAPRYRLLGNAVSEPVVRWIGRRIFARA